MKIAFVQSKKKFSTELFRDMKGRLKDHEIILWDDGEEAPAKDIEIAVVMGKFSREQMEGQTKLLLVQTVSAGYDGIDIDAAGEMGIWVSYSPSGLTGNAVSVAEFAVMLLLGAARRLNQVLEPLRNPDSQLPGIFTTLYGKTVCIVGLGTIGRLLAERLKPFGVKITATDDHATKVPDDIKVFPTKELIKALSTADFVVLCVRATRENKNLINADTLKAMKQGAVLVNIARGTLIDEAALFEAVKSGHIAAAGLDVLNKEPVDPQNPLLTLPQLLITPHTAGNTDLTLKGMADYATQAVLDFAAGKKLKSIVNDPEKPRRQF